MNTGVLGAWVLGCPGQLDLHLFGSYYFAFFISDFFIPLVSVVYLIVFFATSMGSLFLSYFAYFPFSLYPFFQLTLLLVRHYVNLYLFGVLGAVFRFLGRHERLCFCVLDCWYFKGQAE